MKQKVLLAAQDLTKFNLQDYGEPIRPVGFGTQFGPRQTVEVVYHSNRVGPPFATLPLSVVGFMERHSFKEGVDATALVHVLAEVTAPPAPSRGRIENLSKVSGTSRENAIRPLVHELAHVRQAWLLAQDYDKQYLAAGPYERNIFETVAYWVAERYVNQNRSGINSGLYDRYLPDWVTQAK
jgi:hypothetical protein